MVSAGEKGGLLAEILARLATYLENADRLRKKVKTAMMYPTAVTIVAIGITIFLLVKVVPVFKDVYSGFGAALPGPTQFMINLSELVQKYFLLFIITGRRGDMGLVSFHQNQERPRVLGFPPHQAADLRPHRAQNLPGPLHPHPGLARPQRRAHSGSAPDRLPNRRQRRHGKGHQDRRHRHRARRRHFRSPWARTRSFPA